MTQYVICALQMEGFTAGRRLMGNSHISKTHTVISFLLRQSFQFTMQTVK